MLVLSRRYSAPPDAKVQPEPGEVLLFFAYPDHDERKSINEWTAPADPDGYIRRMFWKPAVAAARSILGDDQ